MGRAAYLRRIGYEGPLAWAPAVLHRHAAMRMCTPSCRQPMPDEHPATAR